MVQKYEVNKDNQGCQSLKWNYTITWINILIQSSVHFSIKSYNQEKEALRQSLLIYKILETFV